MIDLKNVIILAVFFHLASGPAWSTELEPPKKVSVEHFVRENKATLAVLRWDPATVGTGVKYSVQYRTNDQEAWRNVPGCVQTELTTCDFAAAINESYGATFQVRTEEGSWSAPSNTVQCIHTHSCSPLASLTALPGSLMLHLSDRDSSLHDEYAAHLRYSVNLSRGAGEMQNLATYQDLLVNGCDAKVADYGSKVAVCGSTVTITGLEVRREYCVKVQYLRYHKPYSAPSHEYCKVIPQSDGGGVVETLVTLVVVLVVAGSFLYLVYKHIETIKQALRPPIHFPDHLEQFLSMTDFPQQPLACGSSEGSVPYDLISIVEEEEDEEREHVEEREEEEQEREEARE